MADWKNADDYEFADAKQNPCRWVWEFLRRNQKYRSDFEAARKQEQEQQYIKVHRQTGRTEYVRVVHPVRRERAWRWHLAGPIQDPADDTIPEFAFSALIVPSLGEVRRYYQEPGSYGDADQRPRYAIVVYRLAEDLGEQLCASKTLLEELRSERGVEPALRNVGNKVFGRYLRLFDAKSAGATTKQITKYIQFYSNVVKKSVDTQAVYKRLNKDHKLARDLITDPWSIIRR